MPAPRDNMSIVHRPSRCGVKATTICGGGPPSSAAVRPPTAAVCAHVPGDEPGAHTDQAQHEQARAPGTGEPDEHGLEYHIGTIADAHAAGSGRRERRQDLIEDQEG